MANNFSELERSLFFSRNFWFLKYLANRSKLDNLDFWFTWFNSTICKSSSFSEVPKNEVNIVLNVNKTILDEYFPESLSKRCLVHDFGHLVFVHPPLEARRILFNQVDVDIFLILGNLLPLRSPEVRAKVRPKRGDYSLGFLYWFIVRSVKDVFFFDEKFIHDLWDCRR